MRGLLRQCEGFRVSKSKRKEENEGKDISSIYGCGSKPVAPNPLRWTSKIGHSVHFLWSTKVPRSLTHGHFTNRSLFETPAAYLYIPRSS